LIGPPATSKTLFLLDILKAVNGVYFDGSNTTNKILDVLEQERPKIICLDEIDKLQKSYQHILLNFMESGRVDVEQQRIILKLTGLKFSVQQMNLTEYPNLFRADSARIQRRNS
jgi:hypothetical protein